MANYKQKYKDETGKTFGKLHVVRYTRTDASKGAMFECVCECGRTVERAGIQLRALGEKNSCGCGRNAPRKPKAEACVVCGNGNIYARNMCSRCYHRAWTENKAKEGERYL